MYLQDTEFALVQYIVMLHKYKLLNFSKKNKEIKHLTDVTAKYVKQR